MGMSDTRTGQIVAYCEYGVMKLRVPLKRKNYFHMQTDQ
jgi:hypothetical protein